MDDLAAALLMAVGVSVVAAVPLLIAGTLNVVNVLRGQTPDLPWQTYLALCAVVPLSYAAAATLAAAAVFVLRPMRRWLLGWMLTGFAVGAAIYGAAGCALAIFYDPVGAEFLRVSTQAEAWAMLPRIIPFFGTVGAVVGAWEWWNWRTGRTSWFSTT